MTQVRYRSLIIFPLVISVSLASIQWAEAATELARVNNRVITLEEFNQKYNQSQQLFRLRTPSKKEMLEEMIKRELGIQEARRLGLDKDPQVIDRMNTVLFHAMLDKVLSDDIEKINVTTEEAKAYYSRNPEIRTSHIFIGVPPGASKEDETNALKRIREIQSKHLSDKSMSFAEVAQRFSEGVAAPMGGDLDYQTRDKLDPAYYEAALALKKPGRVSGIVRTPFGFHIVKLTAIRPWSETDPTRIKRLVFEEKRKALFERLMAQLQSKSSVKINTALLK